MKNQYLHPSPWKTIRFWSLAAAMLLAILFTSSPPAKACVYDHLLSKFNKAVARYNANPTPQNAWQVCQKFRRLTKKFKNRPAPALPPGVMCPPAPAPAGPGPHGGPAGGGGRGGVGGGQGFPGGGGIPIKVWAQNQLSTPCTVTWQVVADSSNPAGFTLTQTSGTIMAGAWGNAPAYLDSFMVNIDPNVAVGTVAKYHVYFIDGCTGFQYTEEFSSFELKALDSITVVPKNVIQVAAGSAPFANTWVFKNHASTQKVVNFDFVFQGDPGSLEYLNDTNVSYFIKNAVMVNKGASSASVTLDPGETEEWDMDKIPTQYCDPEMIECCGISIDGAVSCVWNPNDLSSQTCMGDLDLLGIPQGGAIDIVVDTFNFSVPTAPSMPITQIVDQIALQIQSAFENLPGFMAQPVVDSNGIGIMAPPGTLVEIFSLDAGIEIDTAQCDTVLVVGAAGSMASGEFKVFPNPVTRSEIHYQWSKKEALEIGLYDLSGRKMAQWSSMPANGSLRGRLDLPAEGICPGIYLLRFESKSGTQRFARIAISE